MAGINVPLRHLLKAVAILSVLSAAGCTTGNNGNLTFNFTGTPATNNANTPNNGSLGSIFGRPSQTKNNCRKRIRSGAGGAIG